MAPRARSAPPRPCRPAGPPAAAALVCAALAAAPVAAAGGAGGGDLVADLQPGDWERWGKVWARNPMVVNFYAHHEFKLELGEKGKPQGAPHCPGCPRFAELFANVSAVAVVTGLHAGRLSCTEHRKYCEKLEITTYPQVLLFGKEAARLARYDGPRTLIDVLLWLEEQTGSPVTSVLPAGALVKHYVWGLLMRLLDTAEDIAGRDNRILVALVLMAFLLPPAFLCLLIGLGCCLQCLLIFGRRQQRAAAARRAGRLAEQKKDE
eukprot:TRINITY_DN65814_c0_g1_i1.p1 TRINITY_DN65814_c0_g1~~TRINITY_DN65814_c0_g1_i1.p1  ORF type:complete len:290 (+),score=81.81 TRINITY_DN65814_c0_g1_i1:79-870(+)